MEDKKREEKLARAKEIFTYCMEAEDPRLDEIVWIKTLPLSNPRANRVHNYSEPITVRKAILATLFEFPDCINVDTRTIDDNGIEYYEGKSKFVAPSECTAEQQTAIKQMKEKMETVVSELGDRVTTGEKGNVVLNVNLWMNIEDINFDNIVEWLNSYCARNVDRVGTRETEHIYTSVTKEALERAGIEIETFRWRKIVDKENEISSRDIVEAVEVKEIPEATKSRRTLRDTVESIRKYFEEKSMERAGRRYLKRQEYLEEHKWDYRI